MVKNGHSTTTTNSMHRESYDQETNIRYLQPWRVRMELAGGMAVARMVGTWKGKTPLQRGKQMLIKHS